MHHSVMIVYQQHRLILSSAQLFRHSGGRWSNGADSLSCFRFLFFFFLGGGVNNHCWCQFSEVLNSPLFLCLFYYFSTKFVNVTGALGA